MSDQILNAFVARGTSAERMAFTPSAPTPASGPDHGYLWWDTDTQTEWAYDFGLADWVELAGGGGSGTVTNTGALTDHALIVGNGGVDVSALGSLGTTTTVLHGNAAGDPTFAAVSLTADVTGDLPYANLAQGSALSVLGVTGNATADNASIAAANDHEVLRRSGTAVAFGAVNLGQAAAITGDLPFSNLTQIAGLSVLGVTGSATADVAAITAATDGHVLTRVSSSSLAFSMPAFVKIEEQTPTGTSVTFSSLGSFTHLHLLYTARGDQSATQTSVGLTFNADGGSNYDAIRATFSSTTALGDQVAQTSGSISSVAAGTAPSSYATSGAIFFPDYRGTAFFKVATGLVGGAVLAQSTSNIQEGIRTVTWRSTVAITSFTLTLASGNFVSGSKFSLYGIL